MSDKYILSGKVVLPCFDLLTWAKWFKTANRVVAQDMINGKKVSTVFLGLDHNFSDDGPPLVFETMIFGPDEKYCERYETWDEAEAGHKRAIEKLKSQSAEGDE